MQEEQAQDYSFVLVEDSAESRLFIELSSYGADLTEARGAVELAFRLREQDSPLSDAVPYLIGFAVVAYCRTILASNVRAAMTSHFQIPSDLAKTHEDIKAFRNATIAHSQSDLAVTYPVGVLDGETLEVVHVMGATVSSALPWSVVRDFQTLLERVEDLVDQAIEPVRLKLEARLRGADRHAMVANGVTPSAIHKLAVDFNPKSKRRRFATSHSVYGDPVTPNEIPPT